MKSSYHSLIPSLPLFCSCQFRRLGSIQFLYSQAHILAGWRLKLDSSLSKSKLLYDWRFTANQFVLASSPLRLTTRNFFPQLNPCDISPYVTSSLTIRWVVCYEYALPFVKSRLLLCSYNHSARTRQKTQPLL
jgi:hypothetical protein